MRNDFVSVKDCWSKLDECKSYDDVLNVVKSFPLYTGSWNVRLNICDKIEVTNTYWDRVKDVIAGESVLLDKIPVIKRYYVKALDPEFYDYRVYYDEDMAKEDHLFGVGDDYEINEVEYRELDRKLCDCYSDLDSAQYDHDNGEMSTDELAEECQRLVNAYFKVGEKAFTEGEYQKIYDLCRQYYHNVSTYDELTIMAEVMTIMYGEEFSFTTVRGYSQSDWMRVVYPKRLDISFIGAVLMATGAEFAISCEPIVSAEVFDICDTHCEYAVNAWCGESVKAWAAGIIGCSTDEIAVIE